MTQPKCECRIDERSAECIATLTETIATAHSELLSAKRLIINDMVNALARKHIDAAIGRLSKVAEAYRKSQQHS